MGDKQVGKDKEERRRSREHLTASGVAAGVHDSSPGAIAFAQSSCADAGRLSLD